MIDRKDVVTIRIPFPNISSDLAVRSHMYICHHTKQRLKKFVKCQNHAEDYKGIGNPAYPFSPRRKGGGKPVQHQGGDNQSKAVEHLVADDGVVPFGFAIYCDDGKKLQYYLFNYEIKGKADDKGKDYQ